MIRTTRPTIRNAADRMKDSMCSLTGRSMDRHTIDEQGFGNECFGKRRMFGHGILIVTSLLSLTGCVGPTSRLRGLSATSASSASAPQTALVRGNQQTDAQTPSLQPETSPVDRTSQVTTPALPTDTYSSGESTPYDLSQPVDPQPILQQMNHQAAIGSAVASGPTESPYYTKPTPVSRSEISSTPESVYQLLEGLEPGNPQSQTKEVADDFGVTEFPTGQPYIARQFPQTGQPIAAPQFGMPSTASQQPASTQPSTPQTQTQQPAAQVAQRNQRPAAPAPGTPLPAPPSAGLLGTGAVTGNTSSDLDPYLNSPPAYTNYQGPRVREADLIINGFPARTGRIMLGGAVNSDAGITGQLTIDERNFDITRWPRSFRDMFSGTAFRGAGQTFRLEAAPGSVFKRYTLQFADPNLLGYLPISMSVSGFLYDRRFDDWDEERMGGRLSFGYRITPDLSISAGVTGQNVAITDPRDATEPELDAVLGDNGLWSGQVSLKHDTRNTPIQASEGHYFEFSFEEVFGDYEYSRFELEGRQYWLLNQRADGSGKQTVSFSSRLGFSGKDTPIFENFFAGGYATMRGFEFRGASPVGTTPAQVEVGGRFQWLNTLEYMFPLTADDAFAGVAFVDFGTIEKNIEINADNFRVAPGVGLRIAIPMLGPAPLAFDFAFPVAKADTDQERVFSFYMSMIR